eukprot:6215970-Prymnesium_polylepis.1
MLHPSWILSGQPPVPDSPSLPKCGDANSLGSKGRLFATVMTACHNSPSAVHNARSYQSTLLDEAG